MPNLFRHPIIQVSTSEDFAREMPKQVRHDFLPLALVCDECLIWFSVCDAIGDAIAIQNEALVTNKRRNLLI